MTRIVTHRDMDVWKVSVEFVVRLYTITEKFPDSERFGLTSQIRRAGVSVTANIAEGAARNHTREFVQFLYLSLGSLAEIETHLEIACRLKYLEIDNSLADGLIRIRKMLVSLIRVLKQKLQSGNN